MAVSRPIVIGLGELLWDVFPDGRRPGGVPANVAFGVNQLGCHGLVATAVGNDADGDALVAFLDEKSLDHSLVQRDPQHPTGTVSVQLTAEGHPAYVIHAGVAWDSLRQTPQLDDAMRNAAAVCFGTLAQRHATSRETIHHCLAQTTAECLRVYDVNLRQHYYDRQWIIDSLARATIVKLNHEEVQVLGPLLDLPLDEVDFARRLIAGWGSRIVCVTRAARGCLAVSADEVHEIPGRAVKVADTVGAGDAFTAGMIFATLSDWPLALAAEFANRIGGLVASRSGAMPDLKIEFKQLVSQYQVEGRKDRLQPSQGSRISTMPLATITPGKTKLGWIGTGVMGSSMCGHLLDKGFATTVFNRSRTKAQPLIDKGATWGDSPRAVAERSDVVFAIVGFPQDVREVFLGTDGALAGSQAGTILVDMTTSEPSLAVEISASAKSKGVYAVDAPVSGGDIGAREARLSIMIGGDRDVVEALQPCWEAMGKTIVHQGPAGAGQHTKMVNQILISTMMIGVCEALLYGSRAGLDLETVLKSVSTGAAGSWSLSNLGPRIMNNNFDPGFFVEHFVKDMGIALAESRRMGLSMPGLALAEQLYQSVKAKGWGRNGTHALMLALAEMSGLDWKNRK